MRIFGFDISRRGDAGSEPEAPAPGLPAAARRQALMRGRAIAKRSFEAGTTDRLSKTWSTADLSDNMAMRSKLRAMRGRSRTWSRDTEYGRKFLAMCQTNIVGSAGFSLKVNCLNDAGKPDKADSARVKAGYSRWSKRGQFDVTGKLSERLFDTLAIRMVARDGEALIRLVSGRDRGIHGCQLQLLPAHLLDEEHNRDLPGGARIRMGVEFDAFMKPVAYHLRQMPQAGDMHGVTSQRYIRVPAAEMIHLFLAEDAEQWRGVPWAYAALRGAWQLDKFDEAALVAANVGASKMGFFRQIDPEAGPPMGAAEGEDEESVGPEGPAFITSAEPGEFAVIPDGYQFENFSPEYPNGVYEPFSKSVQRRMSAGLLVSYHGLTGDLREVNFSSIRQGTLDEREIWMLLQSWYVETVKEPVFGWWLGHAMVRDADLSRLPSAKFDKFNQPEFSGRRWGWVDPKSDVQANKESVALGTKSRAQIIREGGGDPETVWAELEEEKARGMTASAGPAAAAAAPNPADDDGEAEEK
jgi:lambda family phage portal protein